MTPTETPDEQLEREIRGRDHASAATWFTGPESFTAMSARDRRTLLRLLDDARAERDAAFKMSKCECGPDEACANLVKHVANFAAEREAHEQTKVERDEARAANEGYPGIAHDFETCKADLAAVTKALRWVLDNTNRVALDTMLSIVDFVPPDIAATLVRVRESK